MRLSLTYALMQEHRANIADIYPMDFGQLA